MSLVAPPSSGSIPPAPRIGTAGSPLDPPQHASLSPREGLGLGGIDMPDEMKGSAAEDRDRKFDTRYLAFKPPRAGHFRHAASVSSPPSLLPFVKSLQSSQFSATGPPAPSVTPRKFSLQPQSMAGASNHSRKVSEDMISYPIISRTDSFPTFTPDEERRPAPVPTTTINGSDSNSHYQRTTPPATKVTTHDEDRTPTPKQRRPSRTTRSPPPPLDLEFAGVSNYSVFPVRTTSGPVKARRGSNATMTEKLEKLEKGSSSSSSSVNGKLKGLRISRNSFRTSSQFDSSDDDEDSLSFDKGSYSSRTNQGSPPLVGHRRTVSEESPRIVQAVAFTRAKSSDDVVPSDLPMQHPVPKNGVRSAGGAPTRTWNTASPALIPISEVKAAKAKAKTLESPTKRPATTTPPRTTPTRLPSESSHSISISVKDSGNSAALGKEFGKAALGRDGVTVCLKSYTKPEDMEVSWTCVPRVDEDGRPFTQWEMKFRPRPTTPSSSGAPPSQPLPPLPCPTHSSSNSSFLNYRINATSSPAPSNFPPPTVGRTYSTTSPLSQTIDPLVASVLPQLESARRRKSSSSSTSRSDSFSNGTSFSSESSVGPPTPSSTGSGGHRRRKSSSISQALSSYDGENTKSALPPLPVPSYFDIPVPPNARSVVSPSNRPESPSRTNRSSSYNAGRTTRQFSIDQSVCVPRSASVPEAGIYVSTSIASPVKSPRDNRFARCLPPTSEAQTELANLSNSSSSPSVSATSSSSASNSGGSFLASRAASRKQSIAAPLSLSIPPTSVDEASAAANRVTSPFTPSPLGRSNVVYSSQSDQQRTPTRPTHFKLPYQATTTPPGYCSFSLPPSSTTEASFVSANSGSPSYGTGGGGGGGGGGRGDGEGGGLSEELVSHPSPCPSTDFDDDEEDEHDEAIGARRAHGRQAKRMMSRWSDTETEEEGGSSSVLCGDANGLTSWGRIPDSNTTDEE